MASTAREGKAAGGEGELSQMGCGRARRWRFSPYNEPSARHVTSCFPLSTGICLQQRGGRTRTSN